MKAGLVSITSSIPSRRSRSSTGWQKVPTPGPYSTKSFVLSQSTTESTLVMVWREEGTIEPTITGFFKNPSRNTARGPSALFNRRFSLEIGASRASSVVMTDYCPR
jgi:hypothetical protein